ncbi:MULTISPECIES: site-specific integrase [Rhizobium]|uniref:Phage integrase n=1 Tax=Rhizobium johnstonii (strain DSM 114642 / LMG 32736 / 3841) TaxID=216596 RepID=Q1M8B2_RHIJ3|nr:MULTISPECIES: site-specific integrase [Rhizobium]NKL44060.1 tyrosine-type recombinase/integrase [Rhizobium leguminosarum bv. viciae]NEI95894.1 tyrosine-type recombinase/integrase [Rhizobium leguminosarum]NEJ81613.1 tyrosine-type recombinase/integrase [Rhizobium leguminosarum]NEK35907.1 tyrosine-type recombinase/integrase [Rhizobium leguminosarum]TBF86416.1 site-specific integrase [Rhizobium leguminosarum]
MTQIIEQNDENDAQAISAPSGSTAASDDLSAPPASPGMPMRNAGLPSPLPEARTALPAHLEQLADRARDYVEAASSANTRRAYATDWKHFSAWCRRQNVSPLPPDPQVVGLYITACASGTAERGMKANTVSTIERRLSAISWNCSQRGTPLDRKDRAIATVMAGIRNTHASPPRQKEAILPEELIAMLETLNRGTLRGLRDQAMLLIGFAGGLRRSEVVGLDLGRDQTEDGRGWIEIFDKGILVTIRGKTGWREVEIGRGSSDATCPIIAVETWIRFAKLAKGPLFRRVTGKGKDVGADRLNDQEVARLVKKTALAAGVRGDLSEGERALKFSGHSLRAGLASSAEVDERYVQKQLGHASAEMTRKYQRRRDRFRVNLTKASGL